MGGVLLRQVRRLAYGVAVFLGVWAAVSVVRVLASPGPLTIRATPAVGFAPLAVTLDLHLIPEADDRTIWITSEPPIDRSDIPLDGAASRRTHHRVWRVTEPGDYLVFAQVGNGMGIRASAQTRISVQ